MTANYLYHEIGHAIAPLSFFTTEEAALGEGSGVLGCNMLVLIKEFLADFSLKESPLQHMFELAESGRAGEAQKLFYLYLMNTVKSLIITVRNGFEQSSVSSIFSIS